MSKLNPEDFQTARQLIEALDDMRWFEPRLATDCECGLVLRFGKLDEDNNVETEGSYVILDMETSRNLCANLPSLIQSRLLAIGVNAAIPPANPSSNQDGKESK